MGTKELEDRITCLEVEMSKLVRRVEDIGKCEAQPRERTEWTFSLYDYMNDDPAPGLPDDDVIVEFQHLLLCHPHAFAVLRNGTWQPCSSLNLNVNAQFSDLAENPGHFRYVTFYEDAKAEFMCLALPKLTCEVLPDAEPELWSADGMWYVRAAAEKDGFIRAPGARTERCAIAKWNEWMREYFGARYEFGA